MTHTADDRQSLAAFDVESIRAHFPILSREVRGKPLVYLDNAATTHKPESVIEAQADFYRNHNSNANRGVHTLGHEATLAFDSARRAVARFINAESTDEIIFTQGATAALNLAAHSLGTLLLRQGDEILLTEMEHHANIVPWQMIAQRIGATVRAIPVLDNGDLDLGSLDSLLTERTRIVSLTHVSNVLGTRNPIARIAERAHAVGAVVVVDGCQAVAHERVDVRSLGADMYAFGAHKMYGPQGVGVLWARRGLLERLPPYQTGGGMIRRVSFSETTFADPPARFEAGTPNIAGAVGLAAAIEFMSSMGDAAIAHERALHDRMREGLLNIAGISLLIATILDLQGVAVRAGHHCAQPLMERFGVPATIRASVACYNTVDEIDAFLAALGGAAETLR